MVLFPPLNYCCVEAGIHRSGTPTQLNFPFLQTLGLKNVIVLSSDGIDEHFECFLEDCGIQPICIGNSGMLLQPITEEIVIKALRILVDKSNYPILITCKTGKILTGAVIACLRKLQRWSFISIFDEYRRIAGHTGSRLQQQHEQFVEQFDTDLVTITEAAPPFLRFDEILHKEE